MDRVKNFQILSASCRSFMRCLTCFRATVLISRINPIPPNVISQLPFVLYVVWRVFGLRYSSHESIQHPQIFSASFRCFIRCLTCFRATVLISRINPAPPNVISRFSFVLYVVRRVSGLWYSSHESIQHPRVLLAAFRLSYTFSDVF